MRWVRAGAKLVILNFETIAGISDPAIGGVGSLGRAEVGLAVLPNTSVEAVFPYLDRVRFIQFLAVSPGFSGQKFDEKILEKIQTLRARDKNAIIEVDGGINGETASPVIKAGANVLVSSSYIWNHSNPREAFLSLKGDL